MSTPSGSAAESLREGLVVSPATVMAIGIFLLFSLEFLLREVLGGEAVRQVLDALRWLLLIWAAYLLALFVDQTIRDKKVLWDYTAGHFAIGTWAAGTNVLAVVVRPLLPELSRVLNGAGWLLWILYMVWLYGMARRPERWRNINGAAFLTTVATQSVVVATLGVWPDAPAGLVYALLGVNLLGWLLYGVHFTMVWIVRGFREQIRHWVPQDNITHGALSISILAAEVIAVNIPESPGWLLRAIGAAWVLDCFVFLPIFLAELGWLLTGKKGLLNFRMVNYSRNFTYGMFFACTWFGATRLPGSLMQDVFSRPVLFVLAGTVAVVNIWEVTHQVATAAGRRTKA